jgi:hypothetical protein
MLTINDLPVCNDLDAREMSAVSGGLCVDVVQAVKDGYKDSGIVGVIVAVAGCLDLVSHGVPVCPA